MLKLAMKIKARAAEREVAGPRRDGGSGDTPKSCEKPAARRAPPEKFLTEKEQRKMEKKLLAQKRKEEKKEKERKKSEKMQKKEEKKGSGAGQEAHGPGAAADRDRDGGAGVGGASGARAEWEPDSGDEDDAYYSAPRVGGVVWRPGPLKAGALGAHLPLVVLLVFSVRSPSWVLSLLLQERTERGRGCGFVCGATCCFRVFLGCAFFSYSGGRARRRGRGRSGGSGQGAPRRGCGERLI